MKVSKTRVLWSMARNKEKCGSAEDKVEGKEVTVGEGEYTIAMETGMEGATYIRQLMKHVILMIDNGSAPQVDS